MVSENKTVGGVSAQQNTAAPLRAVESELTCVVDQCNVLIDLMGQYTEEVMGADTRPVAPAVPSIAEPAGLVKRMRMTIERLHARLNNLEAMYYRLDSGD